MTERSPDTSGYRGLAIASTAVGAMVVPILIGVYVDHRWSTSPWGMIIGATIGVVGGFVHLMLVSRQANRASNGDR